MSTAFLVLWLAASTLLFFVLPAPYLLPSRTISALALGRESETPPPPGQRLLISLVLTARGRLNAAVRRQPAGIPAWAALVCNECLAAWFVVDGLCRLFRGPRRHPEHETTEEATCKS